MKDFSFLFLFKNSIAFKMKKSFKNLCIGDTSTSTNNHQNSPESTTMEDMIMEDTIMELDSEEKMTSRTSLDHLHHRMSCVNSSDILRSARRALNQYPRFSLDGKDARYRSSFRNFDHVTTNISNRRSGKVAEERVTWCKPNVVGKLMGLEEMPIPVSVNCRMNSCLVRKQNLTKSSEMERIKFNSDRGAVRGSCSRVANGYCLMKPVAVRIQ